MYPIPPVPRKFNHQPTTNLIRANGHLQKQNAVQHVNFGISSAIPNYQSNGQKQISSFLQNNEISSSKPPMNSLQTRFANQDRFLSRPSSFENMPAKRSLPIPSSYSVSALQNRIQKERKAHTMAPLARILGPSDTPKAKLFASLVAPTDAQVIKTNHVTPKTPSISHGRSDGEISDDNSTVIVKIIYDPTAGAPPSEDAVRQAVDNRLITRSDKNNKKAPIIVNLLDQNIRSKFPPRTQPQVFNRPFIPFQQRPPVPIPIYPSQQKRNPFPPSITSQPPLPVPPLPPIRRVTHLPPKNENIHPVQAPKTLPNRHKSQSRKPRRLPNPIRANRSSSSGTRPSKSTKTRMASQPATTVNDQQSSSKTLQIGSSGNEVFRPTAVSDVPELSKENLLNMLNQIPDLQGCQFNIEYAPSSAPEGYPIPLNFGGSDNTYPDPVVIDQLPNNIIQHVKRSNNPALTAALEATIRREQNGQSIDRTQASISTLNAQPPTVKHYAAHSHDQVQQSRPSSSNDSDSTTEITSSETSSSSSSSSSSEETDSEEVTDVPSARPTNNMAFVGPAPETSYSDKYYR